MLRKTVAGSSPYEPVIGFSRALRIGNAIYVSGTGPVGADDAPAGAQAEQVFMLIAEALAQAGASLGDVVRTRMYLTNTEDWPAVGAVHGQLFAGIRPAATMVVVAKLLDPSWRVEIEADAIISDTE